MWASRPRGADRYAKPALDSATAVMLLLLLHRTPPRPPYTPPQPRGCGTMVGPCVIGTATRKIEGPRRNHNKRGRARGGGEARQKTERSQPCLPLLSAGVLPSSSTARGPMYRALEVTSTAARGGGTWSAALLAGARDRAGGSMERLPYSVALAAELADRALAPGVVRSGPFRSLRVGRVRRRCRCARCTGLLCVCVL